MLIVETRTQKKTQKKAVVGEDFKAGSGGSVGAQKERKSLSEQKVPHSTSALPTPGNDNRLSDALRDMERRAKEESQRADDEARRADEAVKWLAASRKSHVKAIARLNRIKTQMTTTNSVQFHHRLIACHADETLDRDRRRGGRRI